MIGYAPDEPPRAPVFRHRVGHAIRPAHDPYPAAPARVVIRSRAKEPAPHHRMNPIRPHEQIARFLRAVRAANDDLVAPVLEALHRAAEAQRRVLAARAQEPQQLAAHQPARVAMVVEHRAEIGIMMNLLPVAVADRVGAHPLRDGEEFRHQPQAMEHARADGPQPKHVAAVVEVRGALEERGGDAALPQQRRKGKAADPGAGNDNFHRRGNGCCRCHASSPTAPRRACFGASARQRTRRDGSLEPRTGTNRHHGKIREEPWRQGRRLRFTPPGSLTRSGERAREVAFPHTQHSPAGMTHDAHQPPDSSVGDRLQNGIPPLIHPRKRRMSSLSHSLERLSGALERLNGAEAGRKTFRGPRTKRIS